MDGLHHDLRSVLSAVLMTLQSMETLEASGREIDTEMRLDMLRRADRAVQDAIRLVKRMEESGAARP